MSAGWLGTSWGSEASVIARHEWKGLSKMSYDLEDYVQKERLEAAERARYAPPAPRRGLGRSMVIPGAFLNDTWTTREFVRAAE